VEKEKSPIENINRNVGKNREKKAVEGGLIEIGRSSNYVGATFTQGKRKGEREGKMSLPLTDC